MVNTGATLVAHSGATPITFDALGSLPLPQPMGRMHRPIHHYELAGALKRALQTHGYVIEREQYAIQTNGARLFGALDVKLTDLGNLPGTGFAVAFRHANDQTMPFRMVAGTTVFICDNLVLSGAMDLLRRKHTPGFRIFTELYQRLYILRDRLHSLTSNIQRLQDLDLTYDRDAKAWVFDAFTRDKVAPLRHMPAVWETYTKGETEDTAPRTGWGLHNAFTRVFGAEMPNLNLRMEATHKLGRTFGL